MNAGVRAASPSDAAAIARIYNHYVAHTVVTFDEEPIADAEMQQRLAEVADGGLPWLVAEEGNGVLGYAYASRWKGRCAYRFSLEVTVYLDAQVTGRGWGSRLYTQLFEILRERGTHAVMAGIALPNPASVALHEKLGLTKVAHFREVGFKFGHWVDVGYWQRVFDGAA